MQGVLILGMQLLLSTGTVVLGNNERIKIPDALLIVWEVG